MLATVPAHGAVAPDGAEIRVVPSLDEVVAALESGRIAAAAIDIPIGLAADGSRACDRAARRLLDRDGARSSPRAGAGCPRCGRGSRGVARSVAVGGGGLSKQLYNIMGKIREADELLTPACSDSSLEACPELSFARVVGRRADATHQAQAAGRARARRQAWQRLKRSATSHRSSTARPAGRRRRDDVFDALVLAWTARRSVAGDCVRLGGEADGRGLRMEISA